MTHTLPVLVLVGLATVGALARLTRLATGDTITEPVRDRIESMAAPRELPDQTVKFGPAPWRFLAGIIRCHWCAAIWIAAPMAAAYLTWATGTPPWNWAGSWWFVWAVAWLGGAHTVATLADWLDSPPPVRQHEVTLHRH